MKTDICDPNMSAENISEISNKTLIIYYIQCVMTNYRIGLIIASLTICIVRVSHNQQLPHNYAD